MFIPDPVYKIKDRLCVEKRKITMMLFEPVVHLGRGRIGVKPESFFDEDLVGLEFFLPVRLTQQKGFVLLFAHRKILAYRPSVDAQ